MTPSSSLVRKLQREQQHWNECVQNSLSTNRPSFAAANQVVTDECDQWTRRVTSCSAWQVRSGQFSQFNSCAVKKPSQSNLSLYGAEGIMFSGCPSACACVRVRAEAFSDRLSGSTSSCLPRWVLPVPRNAGAGVGAKLVGPQIVARPPNLAVLLTHCGQLILRKISKSDATRCQILRLKCTKFDIR